MEIKLDLNKTYAIALEGGGAKGAYEVGVWKALEEAGVKYNAVAGTSVGALNGAMMAMRDLPGAIAAWSSIQLGDVVDLSEGSEDNMLRLFAGEADIADLQELLPQVMEIIKNRGLDVSPLRRWIGRIADTAKIKNSDVELVVTTIDLSDKMTMTVNINQLPEDEMCDMLLASAYHPSFRMERLGGKYYADGGFFDSLPIYPLVERGYKDIIAVCLPGKGIHRPFIPPKDVNITYIDTEEDLGGVLCFDGARSVRNMEIGYLDAKKVLCGLSGKRWYIEQSMDEREALSELLDICSPQVGSVRRFVEKELPKIADRLGVEDGGYHDILTAYCEREADKLGVERMRIYKDRELLSLVRKC